MKVVFLDIDGVLNRTGGDYSGKEHPLDIELIERMNRIAAATGAGGVLTSTWRLLLPWPRCRDALVAHGLALDIVGETRDLWARGEHLEPARRREIEDWLARNPVDAYVVIDDTPVYPDDHPRFVRTLETEGLTESHVEQIVALLL